MQDSRPQRAKSLHSLWTPAGRVNRHRRRSSSVRPKTLKLRRSPNTEFLHSRRRTPERARNLRLGADPKSRALNPRAQGMRSIDELSQISDRRDSFARSESKASAAFLPWALPRQETCHERSKGWQSAHEVSGLRKCLFCTGTTSSSTCCRTSDGDPIALTSRMISFG